MSAWLEQLESYLKPEDLDKARQAEAKGKDVFEFLLKENLLPAEAALASLSQYYKLPYVELSKYHPESAVLEKVPEDTARRFKVLPLFVLEDRLYVAFSNPEELQGQDYLRQLTGLSVEMILASPADIEEAQNKHYVTREHSARHMEGITEVHAAKEQAAAGELKFEDESAPAIKLVNYIITQAIRMGASDIHLEPFAEQSLLRYRVDGVLHSFPPPPLNLFRALVSRIKIISNLDIAEKRLPQDGRATITVDNLEYDLRVSVIPNLHGEGIVIRILDTHGKKKQLEDLGFAPEMREQYQNLITKPYGIILFTGPTGSGKTTSLYATLNHIFTPKKKIITLEDPVEYQLDGMTQIQVNADIGFTFASGLRAVLRHDPDIVMIGEIRDAETAEIAVRSSLTGHLVFSTLHTNDAPSAITRLIDMGLPSYLILASLLGIVAQRLVRRLCPACKTEMSVTPAVLASLGLEALPPGARIYQPVGCQACANLGYKGRVGIYELLEITPKLRGMGEQSLNLSQIRNYAEEQGIITLRKSAMQKLFAGLTSLEEVLTLTTEQ